VVVCSVCGEPFDEYRYQVCSPGLPGTFDRVACLAKAVAAAARAARVAADEQRDALGIRLGIVDAVPSAQDGAFDAALERGYQPLARYRPPQRTG
jgi:hypothetical protein